jgi:POT family proton-dependent oligopeptide transporter
MAEHLKPIERQGPRRVALDGSACDQRGQTTTPLGSRCEDRKFLGHPRGLVFISGTEFWERISFHGMQALLVLYMVEHLLLPGNIEKITGFHNLRLIIEWVTGPLSRQALASQIFGLYVGLVYFTPVFGGLLGDRVLGRRRAVTLGALLLTAGHFCMAFESRFVVALLLLICGAGILRGNLISQLGDLYSKDDHRRESGFQIYFSLVNLGAFFAPLITGVLRETHGWHYAFGFASFGMLAGLVSYILGAPYLPADTPRRVHTERPRLKPDERRVVVFLLLLLPILTLFWIAQTQIWNTYNVWVRDHLDLLIAGWKMPVAWLQAVDGLAAVLMVPPVLLFWRWQAARAREPDDFTKLATGCLIFGAALLWLAGSQLIARCVGTVPLWWALAFHAISNIGYVYFAPTATALFSRCAPVSVNAMMIGIYYVSLFIGSTVSGRLGALYEHHSVAQFWLLHAAVVVVGGCAIAVLSPLLRRELEPQSDRI